MTCPRCYGTGEEPTGNWACIKCKGSGQVNADGKPITNDRDLHSAPRRLRYLLECGRREQAVKEAVG